MIKDDYKVVNGIWGVNFYRLDSKHLHRKVSEIWIEMINEEVKDNWNFIVIKVMNSIKDNVKGN